MAWAPNKVIFSLDRVINQNIRRNSYKNYSNLGHAVQLLDRYANDSTKQPLSYKHFPLINKSLIINSKSRYSLYNVNLYDSTIDVLIIDIIKNNWDYGSPIMKKDEYRGILRNYAKKGSVYVAILISNRDVYAYLPIVDGNRIINRGSIGSGKKLIEINNLFAAIWYNSIMSYFNSDYRAVYRGRMPELSGVKLYIGKIPVKVKLHN